MNAKRVIRIGQEVFVLSHDGEVIRTMVAGLDEKGYRFLDGSSHRRPHWFTFKDAVVAASDRINARQTALRKALRTLALKRRALETQEYQDGVMREPYKVVDLQAMMTYAQSRRSRKLKKIRVPETHLALGHMVYVIITPMTHSESREYAYRPHKHFVLETAVKSVCFSPDGQVHYTFSTPYVVDKFFLSRTEAGTGLQKSFSEPGTKDFVYFVSSKQEREELDKIPDDIPF
jgi:hypothetical protein